MGYVGIKQVWEDMQGEQESQWDVSRSWREMELVEGAARVSWCERELLIGQTQILFYFIFSCLFKNTKYLLPKGF